MKQRNCHNMDAEDAIDCINRIRKAFSENDPGYVLTNAVDSTPMLSVSAKTRISDSAGKHGCSKGEVLRNMLKSNFFAVEILTLP